MSRTSNVFARVEPELKEQAENILNKLGIPMSNAISIFLKQIVMQRGIPFELKLPQTEPKSLDMLSEEEFNAEIEKGFADMQSGKMRKAEDVYNDFHSDYGI